MLPSFLSSSPITPLWYYMLNEAEVLLGLIDADPGSYRNAAEEWQPELPAVREGDFTVADLLRFAKIA